MKLTILLVLFGIIVMPALSSADDLAVTKQGKLARLLSQAQEFQQTGRCDLAWKRFEQTLQLDPENAEARAGEQRIEAVRVHPRSVEVRDAQKLYHPVNPVERVKACSKPSQ